MLNLKFKKKFKVNKVVKKNKRRDKEFRKYPRSLRNERVQRSTFFFVNFKSQKFKYLYKAIVVKTLSAGFIRWKVFKEFLLILKWILKKKKFKPKLYINTAINWPITKKPLRVRMGRGKGVLSFDDWVSRIKAGKVLLEIHGRVLNRYKFALLKALPRLGIPCTLLMHK